MADQTNKTGGTNASSAEEWKEIWSQFAQQVRRDAARVVGEAPDAGWSIIGRKAGEASRQEAAKLVNAPKDADWETIGRHIEINVRTGVAGVVGASPDADWSTVGQTVDHKVRSFLQSLLQTTKPNPPSQPKDDELVDPWK